MVLCGRVSFRGIALRAVEGVSFRRRDAALFAEFNFPPRKCRSRLVEAHRRIACAEGVLLLRRPLRILRQCLEVRRRRARRVLGLGVPVLCRPRYRYVVRRGPYACVRRASRVEGLRVPSLPLPFRSRCGGGVRGGSPLRLFLFAPLFTLEGAYVVLRHEPPLLGGQAPRLLQWGSM